MAVPYEVPAGIAGIVAPSGVWRAITPNDNVDLADGRCRAIYIGGAGNLKCRDKFGNAITFYSVAAGSVLPLRASRVYATGTTATYLVALY